MKAARRTPRPRKGLLPSGEGLHTRLKLVEEAQGLRARRTFIFMPASKDSKPAEQFPEGEGPQRGDVCIYFEPLFDTEAEARMSVAEFCAQTCRKADVAPAALPWKRTLTAPDPPERSRDPDPELAALAEATKASDLRPLTEDEMQDAARGLLQTGNLFRGGVVRDALAGRQVPLGDDKAYPCAEFCSSDRGTLLIRVWNHAADQARPRAATEEDRTRWPAAFARFLAQLSPLFRPPNDEDSR